MQSIKKPTDNQNRSAPLVQAEPSALESASYVTSQVVSRRHDSHYSTRGAQDDFSSFHGLENSTAASSYRESDLSGATFTSAEVEAEKWLGGYLENYKLRDKSSGHRSDRGRGAARQLRHGTDKKLRLGAGGVRRKTGLNIDTASSTTAESEVSVFVSRDLPTDLA
jgi:hypothetical protein